MSATRTVRTEDELRRASEHVGYEVTMLLVALRAYTELRQKATTAPTLKHEALSNCLLNAFLLPARNLIEFLQSGKGGKQKDDICVGDFLSTVPALPKSFEVFEEEQPDKLTFLKHVHKRLAHLTYVRDSGRAEWCLLSIASPIAEAMEKAFGNETSSRIDSSLRLASRWLKAYVDEEAAKHPNLPKPLVIHTHAGSTHKQTPGPTPG